MYHLEGGWCGGGLVDGGAARLQVHVYKTAKLQPRMSDPDFSPEERQTAQGTAAAAASSGAIKDRAEKMCISLGWWLCV